MTDERDDIVNLRRYRERPLKKAYSDAEKELHAAVIAAVAHYWKKRLTEPLVTDYVDLHDADVFPVEDTILNALISELVRFAKVDNVTARSLLQMVAGKIKMVAPEDVDVTREIPGELLVGECGYGLGYDFYVKTTRVPQANGLDVVVETDPGLRDVLHVVCNGERIGSRLRFSDDRQWRAYKPGYRVSGGLDDSGSYDDLVVERLLQKS